MKTGILTFVHTSNYGAVLQAYAMQTLLGKMGTESEFINYSCPKVLKSHDPKFLWERAGLKNKLAFPFLYYVYNKRLRKFLRFEKKYLKFSEASYNRKNINEAKDCYEKIIVGSDQVWNPSLTGGDMSFFLDFIRDEEKKLSYGASIGTEDFKDEYREKCYSLLKGFSHVNVREEASANALKAHGIDEKVVLDPTLMLDKKEWLGFVGKRPRKKKYILMYMSPWDKVSIGQIRSYAEKNDCEIYLVKKGLYSLKGIKVLNTLSPEEFLTWLYHAELVISGSFHGVCFSLLFEKPFRAFFAPSESLTCRIDDILSRLCLSDLKYQRGQEITDGKIDFIRAKGVLAGLRESSLEALKEMLQTG